MALGVAANTIGKVIASTVFMSCLVHVSISDFLLFVKNGFVVGVRCQGNRDSLNDRGLGREGGREGGLMKGTSEEGTGRGMDGGRDEASGGGIKRGREGAREQEREISREVS